MDTDRSEPYREHWLVRFRWPLVGGWFAAFTVAWSIEGKWAQAVMSAVFAIVCPLIVGSDRFRQRVRERQERTHRSD